MESHYYAHHWCSGVVKGLIDLGLDHFFIGPGSRSSPLVSAIVRNQHAEVFLGIDERSVGFMALGYSKKAQKAGVVVVTSGTAVANLYPAVVEAYMSHVPLLLLTADRPYELRDSGANQTIFQAGLFANHINKSYDLSPPVAEIPWQQSKAIIEHAVFHTSCPQKGPVHVNLQFREPLTSLHNSNGERGQPAPIFNNNYLSATEVDISPLLPFFSSKRGLIVVGELMPKTIQEDILKLASILNWPIFADITSNLRFTDHPNIIHHFDLCLLNDRLVKQLNLEAIVKLGGRVVSKRLWNLVENNSHIKLLSINEAGARLDPSGCFTNVYVANIKSTLASVVNRIIHSPLSLTPKTAEGDNFFASLFLATRQIAKPISEFLTKKADNEAYYAARLIELISEPANLFVSSGMPIRDLDQCSHKSTIPIHLFANRGASGIDGVISSSVGVACADKIPTILLIGDVAFLHDTNGLMLISQAKAPILIVVINNNGGGIFHFLPIAKEQDVLTPFLDTPHDVVLASLCQAHKVQHHIINHPSSFDEAIMSFFRQQKSMVIEVIINKAENVHLHKEFYAHIADLPLSLEQSS